MTRYNIATATTPHSTLYFVAHLFENLEDFYGSTLSICLFGYLRDECSFNNVDELISCIKSDIDLAREKIDVSQFYTKYVSADVHTSGIVNW